MRARLVTVKSRYPGVDPEFAKYRLPRCKRGQFMKPILSDEYNLNFWKLICWLGVKQGNELCPIVLVNTCIAIITCLFCAA